MMASLLIKGFKDSRVEYGNTLIDDKFDKHPENRFDYLLANPPFGVDWKAEKKVIDRWPNFRGYSGKLPRVNDGALLFLIHMIAKFQPYEEGNKAKPGTRVAIVFNGSPLFTGGAGSGESEIRRWIIEHDWLEAIIALPEQTFYNTGIGTYVWVVSNRKSAERRGRIQLIDARDRWTPMKRSLGDKGSRNNNSPFWTADTSRVAVLRKGLRRLAMRPFARLATRAPQRPKTGSYFFANPKRRYLNEEAIDTVTREHGAFVPSETSKLFDNTDFGYRRISVQRPLRLKFQYTNKARDSFVDALDEKDLGPSPNLISAIEQVGESFGGDVYPNWNILWPEIQKVMKRLGANWLPGAKGTAQKKLFRDCFTETDPAAEPVIAKHGKRSRAVHWADLPKQTLPDGMNIEDLDPLFGVYPDEVGKKQTEYEPDPKLKDFENIPLKEDIVSYFLREVQPYVPDAWIDRKAGDEQDGGIGKLGYEINFNREFFQYQPPRPLAEIDAELAEVEKRIMGMLREMTE